MGFFSNLLGFENSFSKNFTKDILKKPTRLLTGIDPGSTKIWNKALGRDDPALVNWFGSPGQKYYDQAQAEGIDTDAAGKFHTVADTVAGIYGGSGLAGSLGFGGLGAASGPTNTAGLFTTGGNIAKVANAATSNDPKNGGSNMGLFDSLSGVLGSGSSSGGGSGMGGLLAGAGGALLGAMGSKDAQKAANTPWTSQSTQTTTLDPRMQQMLYGGGGNAGLFGQIQNALNQPRAEGAAAFGQGADKLLGGQGTQMLNNIYAGNNALMSGYQEPSMQGAQADAAQVRAPSQNQLNLSPAYQNFIYGNAAENPYLKQSLQAGVDQSTQAFNTQLGNLTDTLQRNIMPGIRGGAIASGQYGGSRQGIAEGLAMSDLSKQATNAAQAFGLGNTAATTGAYANAFNQGQDRSLGALQNLSGQQYNTAFQNANMQQQANLSNAAARQAADMANMNALMQTRGQNSSNMQAGLQGTQGLLNTINNAANQNDQYNLTRAAQGTGLLSPFLNAGATNVTSGSGTGQPMTSNTGANILGGAAAGLGLYNQFSNLFKSPANSNIGGGGGSFIDAFGKEY